MENLRLSGMGAVESTQLKPAPLAKSVAFVLPLENSDTLFHISITKKFSATTNVARMTELSSREGSG